MGGNLNIPEDEQPNLEEVELLSKEEFLELAYQVWWKLAASASRLCFGRVGRVIGRSASAVRHYYSTNGWKDRRELDRKSEKERPGAWIKGRIQYRVAKEDSYLLEHERKESNQVINTSTENSIAELDPHSEEIRSLILLADPRTKEGVLTILAGGIQSYKEAYLEGRVDVSKPIDFARLVELQTNILTGRTQGSSHITILIKTGVPRPPDKDILTIEPGKDEAIDAEYVEVKEIEDVSSDTDKNT